MDLYICIFTGGILFWREDSVYGWSIDEIVPRFIYIRLVAFLFNIRAQHSADDGVKKGHMILYRVIVVEI